MKKVLAQAPHYELKNRLERTGDALNAVDFLTT